MGKKNKERKLTAAEQRRLDQFNVTCEELAAQGYQRVDLSIGIVAANVVALVALAVLFVVCLLLFHMVHPETDLFGNGLGFVAFIVAILVLTVVHELIHGLFWSRFTPNGFKDIEFGIMMDSLTPYCVCKVPLRKGSYVLGTLAPLVILGVIPLVVAFCIGSVTLLYVSIIMVVAATGDVMIVTKFLAHQSPSDDVLLYDHPTEAGSVVFER